MICTWNKYLLNIVYIYIHTHKSILVVPWNRDSLKTFNFYVQFATRQHYNGIDYKEHPHLLLSRTFHTFLYSINIA